MGDRVLQLLSEQIVQVCSMRVFRFDQSSDAQVILSSTNARMSEEGERSAPAPGYSARRRTGTPPPRWGGAR
jgi:hypothetical protein